MKKVVDGDSGEAAKFVECPSCLGLGYIEVYQNEHDCMNDLCPTCDGAGVIEERNLPESMR